MIEREPRKLAQGSPLICVECKREWLEPGERWRIYLTGDEPPEAVSYCPDCAAYEFDP